MSAAELGGRCGDTHPAPAGVYNQGDVFGPKDPCTEITTHTLNGKSLCKTHWLQGLAARKKADARVRSYSNQLRNYQR
jgi:hypothetical protein